MIRLRRGPGDTPEEVTLDEFERRARAGEIQPQHEVCFPAVTGEDFVQATELELYRGLYASGLLTFKRYFHLARMPYLTLGMIALLCCTYFFWQGGAPRSTDDLVRLGAKSPVFMVELGQWWRLVTANVLHVSTWHLVVNVIFLFNLGGPTEAIFRRLDYVLVLVAGAIGTTLVSTLANPVVSCGASGIVFGVWGAAAVFGVRHHDLLPHRYRRYFIGTVIPYAIAALYLGFAIPGVDNWGHLGGLMAGSATALFLPARLLEPHDRLVPAKLFALGVMALGLAGISRLPAGPGSLTMHRYYPNGGLAVPVPWRWHMVVSERGRGAETYAFDNGAGVTLGVQAQRLPLPVERQSIGRRFVEVSLAQQFERTGVRGLKLSDPQPTTLAGLPADRIEADVLTPEFLAHATYIVAARGYYHYVISFTAPQWVAGEYRDTLDAILAAVEIGEPDELLTARRHLAAEDTPMRHARLAVALAHAGDIDAATVALRQARSRWPEATILATTEDRLERERKGTVLPN
ncbi:MAG: rhomboid family intramembrane serine protease [Myxococcota bacterium]